MQTMNTPRFFEEYRANLIGDINTLDLREVERAALLLREARDRNRSIFVFGNGGSMATASHFVCDVLKGASFGREQRYRIQCLLDNSPTLTAYSNDVDYHDAVLEQLKNFAEPGDVTLAISGSGNSSNVVKATAWARENGLKTIVMTGRDGGRLKPEGDCVIHTPEQHMGRIEDVHMIACHMIAYLLMEDETAKA